MTWWAEYVFSLSRDDMERRILEETEDNVEMLRVEARGMVFPIPFFIHRE